MWSNYWKTNFRAHTSNEDKAIREWQKSCGSLFQLYCTNNPIGRFTHQLMINKLIPMTTPGAKTPYFTYTGQGCGICKKWQTSEQKIGYHQLLQHILCECPIVLEVLQTLGLTSPPTLYDIVNKDIRIKHPNFPKIAYAAWSLERGLRISGLSGTTTHTIDRFGSYLNQVIGKGPIQPYSTL